MEMEEDKTAYEYMVELYNELVAKELDVDTFISDFLVENARAVVYLGTGWESAEDFEYPFDVLFPEEEEDLTACNLQMQLLCRLHDMKQTEDTKFEANWEDKRLDHMLSERYPIKEDVREEFTTFCRTKAEESEWKIGVLPKDEDLLSEYTDKYLWDKIRTLGDDVNDDQLQEWENYVKSNDISKKDIYEQAEAIQKKIKK